MPTRRGMVGKVLGLQAGTIALAWKAHKVSCTPAHGRRYSRPAAEHQLGGALVANDVLGVRILRGGPNVRVVGASGGAMGRTVRRRHRVRPSANDGDFGREYRNDSPKT